MKLTAYDTPCDAMGNRLSGGWPALRGNAQSNHASPKTTTDEGCRHEPIHHADMDHQPADAGAHHRPRLATWGSGYGATDVRIMTADHWRPDHA